MVNQHGTDVLQGVGLNRDLAAREEASIVLSGTAIHPVIDSADTLTIRIDNNVAPGAFIQVDLYYGLGSGT